MNPPLLDRLRGCRRVLLAGAGGGYDVVAGIPLWKGLGGAALASLSFSDLRRAEGRRLPSGAVEVRGGPFLEGWLAEWTGEPVWCFEPSGVRPLRQVYQELLDELQPDALVLVDGGTDSLMRGDEPSLGTPAEDMASLAAVAALEVPVKLLVNLGFGVDRAHGVCHAYVLEAAADLTPSGGFLGAFSLLPSMPEFQALAECVDHLHARMPGRESIVMSSVVAAAQGRFGDHHPTARTAGSRLFLNPLMAMYWAFELDAVARRCLYLEWLEDTWSRWDVDRVLRNYLHVAKTREWMEMDL